MARHTHLLAAGVLAALPLAAHAQSAPADPINPAAGYAAHNAATGNSTVLRQGQYFFSTLSSSSLAGQTESYLRYGLTNRLSGGVAYLQRRATFRPNLSYTIVPESLEVPALTVGMYHDTVRGGRQGYFATSSRTIRDMGSRAFSAYVGLGKLSNEKRVRGLVGGAIPLGPRFTASAQWESKKLNLGLVADLGMVSGFAVRFGVVAIGDRFGPLTAATWQR